MKNKTIFTALLLIAVFSFISFGNEELFFNTMKEEMKRSIEKLEIENLQKPFFISYTILDGDYLVIRASLGSLISVTEKPNKYLSTRVMTGSYERSNENFFDMSGKSGTSSYSLPVDENYFGIRRALWLSTDRAYKQAAELYESKISAIGQQNLPEDTANLPDFAKKAKSTVIMPSSRLEYNRQEWETIARDVSALFMEYPDIFSSGVSVYFYSADVYFSDSEGTCTKVPFNFAALYADAYTQADDGEPVFDYLTYFGNTPEDLPAPEIIRKEIRLLAERTILLREAEPFDDSYMGPVLFEGDAVGESIAQSLFSSNSGMNAMRDPIYSDSRIASYVGSILGDNFEDMLEKRLLPKEFTIKAVPGLKSFKDTVLTGSFQVDAEGVEPPEELILVENGILKTLLNGRTPTAKIRESNGHNRLSLSGNRMENQIGPGVIRMEADEKGLSRKELKELLLETARDEGLEYGIIIRKVQSPTANVNMESDPLSLIYMMSQGPSAMSQPSIKPVYVYKVYAEDGREELVRSADMSSISARAFRDIIGWSDEMTAYNTIIVDTASSRGFGRMMLYFGPTGWPLSGIPSSFIVPDAILFESLELKKEKRPVTTKPPVIPSPLKKQ